MKKEQYSGDLFTPEQIESILHTPEARKLFTQLRAGNKAVLSEIHTCLQSRDMEKAKSLLQPITDNQETQQLLQSIRNKIG